MPVLDQFYGRVRLDPVLGPVFESIVTDWNEHLQRLEDFWSSIMLTSGRYKGNPIAMHLIHTDQIQPHMFLRWLELWRVTTDDMLPGDVALQMQAKAARIGERLNRAMHGPDAVAAIVSDAQSQTLEPYRRSQIFDQTTLPTGLLKRHATKAGTWAVIKIIEGQVVLHYDGETALPSRHLHQSMPGFIAPLQPHHLELVGPVRLQIEFFDRSPSTHSCYHQQGMNHAYASKS